MRNTPSKHQAPSSKLQRKTKHQAPSPLWADQRGLFGSWNLKFPWSLELGAWSFRQAFLWSLVLGAWCFCQAPCHAATNSGLWVGQVTLSKVNETVGGVNAANQLVSPAPSVTTPVASAAHLQVIFHVDSQGQVRLLKSVAVLPKTTNQPPGVALITDPSLYPNFSSTGIGKRIAAAAFDFGESNAVSVLDQVAANAAAAASTNGNPTNAANQVVQAALSGVTNASPAYSSFLTSATFQSSARIAAAAASAAVSAAPLGSSQQAKQILASGAALKALTDGQIFAAADGVVANEVKMNGSIAAGGIVTGSIYLGASHPTNPFRHRRHPDHTIGYPISRALTVQFDGAASTNALVTSGFGVSRITGTYREEIQGLHKPLGPNQNIGLITEGPLVLDRISQVDTLNQ